MTSNLVFQRVSCLTSAMLRLTEPKLRRALVLLISVAQALVAVATSKPHVITFGKWTTVQWSPESMGSSESEKPLALKLRPLLVDSHVKEFTLGPAHDVTDRLFVVRRAFRVNDSLPQESAAPPHWQWQRGGWLLVDRVTGRISSLNLPEFDVSYSAVSWYRDYAAYCGISDDGTKLYAVVAQIGRRKAVSKKVLVAGSEKKDAPADSTCSAPTWQRNPSRVTFEPADGPKQTFAVRGHSADLMVQDEDDEEASK